jgi:starch synthase
MNIVLTSAEVAPFAKAGGLADVAAALPKGWHKLGHNVIIILPKYGNIDTAKHNIEPTDMIIGVPFASWTEYARLWKTVLPGEEAVPVYFLQNADYFDREGIYGNPDGFTDNDRRFAFFSRAVFETCKALGFKPDILHAHDYHTALTMPLLKIQPDPFFSSTAGVFTIHNLAYQGWFEPRKVMEWCGWGMKHFFTGSWFEMNGLLNAMKAGIMFADKVTTVSPTYANEIRWTKYGEGLQDFLHARSADLIGVLNGVDYEEWNPQTDELLYKPYDSDTLADKALNKKAFLQQAGIPDFDLQKDIPLVGMVSRLTGQKGVELIEQVIEDYLKYGALRLALLGNGESRYEQFFNYLARKYPGRALVTIGYNNALSHKIIGCCDYLLVPSRFEPCGLTQMYAMKYGTIPIVRATGGLADTVQEYNPAARSGTGFTFPAFRANDFSAALRRALAIYRAPWHWDAIRKNAMNKDFSSVHSAENYLNVFTWALQKIGR